MKTISLFTGAMGLDLGLESAGFETAVAVEKDPHARSTIHANRPGIKVFEDAFTVSKEELLSNGPIDIVAGGPPCQSWSSVGSRGGLEDHRGLCIPRFLEIVEMIRPSAVVMENVPGLATAEIDGVKGAMPAYIQKRLEDAGYTSSFEIVNSADFGSPQCRRRIVFLAVLSALSDHAAKDRKRSALSPRLSPTHALMQQLDLFEEVPELPKWQTLKDAIWDLRDDPGEGASYPESQMQYLRLLKEGQDWRDLPDEIKEKAIGGAFKSEGGRTGFFRRLRWDRPAPTLVCCPTQKSTCLCHPDRDRPLSVKEYARIQGFPDDWKFMGSKSARYKQIGNAVPVQLGKAIGMALAQRIARDNVR